CQQGGEKLALSAGPAEERCGGGHAPERPQRVARGRYLSQKCGSEAMSAALRSPAFPHVAMQNGRSAYPLTSVGGSWYWRHCGLHESVREGRRSRGPWARWPGVAQTACRCCHG